MTALESHWALHLIRLCSLSARVFLSASTCFSHLYPAGLQPLQTSCLPHNITSRSAADVSQGQISPHYGRLQWFC